MKPLQAFASGPVSTPPNSCTQYSPLLVHRRSPLSLAECYSQPINQNVQLLGIHPRPESAYIKELPTPPTVPSQTPEQIQETDFPFIENVEPIVPTSSFCCDTVEKAFDYLPSDDDDNDVIHETKSSNTIEIYDNAEHSEGNDSVDTIDLDATTSTNHQNDSGIQTLSSRANSEKRHDSQEKLTDYQSTMASSSRGTGSEDNDSDFDNQSHEDDIDNDDEQINNQKEEEEENEENERQKQIILRQQKILWSITQEWLRKEQNYIEQLEKMEQQLNYITIAVNLSNITHRLISRHNDVCKEIENLYERDHQPTNLTKQLTRSIDVLMQTLPLYDDYIKMNLAPIRKALDKRNSSNGMSSEELLSIPTKQFLQILSQVQDLHRTAKSFESNDQESLLKLYDHAQKCKSYGLRQDENINKIVLKNEDVVTMIGRSTRDRCRLILYPDVIVCCNLKAKLLASPKYSLIWFIPMVDINLTVPQSSSDDSPSTGDELKSHLKSAYKELEKSSNNNASSRLTKNIRKQENEYNLVQCKLQLVLSNPQTSNNYTILFSSAYQRQDWIDLIEKTKQELLQRISTYKTPSSNPQQRLTESILQKRLDLVKPNLHEVNPQETSSISNPSKTYSGTLNITIHSIHGSALYDPLQQQQNHFQYYVVVEIDSYNTFYPYAQTARQSMKQQDLVEFKGEVFQVELEHSLAFRLLIYRFDPTSSNTSKTQRAQCIGKFHRNIETALRDCERDSNSIIAIESLSGDLKLRISLKYAQRDGTFKRQRSKRSLAVFGKSIDKLISTTNGCIEGIPRIIVTCIRMVDCDGLKETGIYRVCCVTSDLQKLRHQFDRNYQVAEEMLAGKNVHVAANLLKLFFRELPEPLFTSTYYEDFLQAIQLTDIDNQRVTLLKILESLNSDNRRILYYLLDHLIRVSQYSDTNMMHLDNLAVVFGPTLMRPSKLSMTKQFSASNQRLNAATDLDQMSNELQGSMYQCQVVLTCLKLRRDGLLK